ncbi:uncharacterized protein LOC134243922, partial [Saccostrea cucullata]|uniref:uncharacterized protein LOC134243922 n=1 Tax=Saccostrea cuccullata TaxID=36930 RepID=UPI002ECFCEE3
MNNLGVQHPSQPTTCINTNSHVSQQLFLPPMNNNRHPMNINNLGVHQSSLPPVNMNNLSQLRFPFVIYPVNNLCNMVQVPNNITFPSTNNAQNMQKAENHMTETDTKTTTLSNPNLNHSNDIAPVTMSFNQNSAVTVSNSNVINTTVDNLKILNSGVPQGALNHHVNVQTQGLLKQVLNVPNAVTPLLLVPNSAANLAVTKKCFKIKLTPIRPAPQKNSTRDTHRPTQGTESQKKTLPENNSKTVLPADVEVTEQSFPVIFHPVQEQDSSSELEKVQVKMEENLVENEIQSSTPIGEDQRVGNSLEALQ